MRKSPLVQSASCPHGALLLTDLARSENEIDRLRSKHWSIKAVIRTSMLERINRFAPHMDKCPVCQVETDLLLTIETFGLELRHPPSKPSRTTTPLPNLKKYYKTLLLRIN